MDRLNLAQSLKNELSTGLIPVPGVWEICSKQANQATHCLDGSSVPKLANISFNENYMVHSATELSIWQL